MVRRQVWPRTQTSLRRKAVSAQGRKGLQTRRGVRLASFFFFFYFRKRSRIVLVLQSLQNLRGEGYDKLTLVSQSKPLEVSVVATEIVSIKLYLSCRVIYGVNFLQFF